MEKEFELKLGIEAINFILNALADKPYRNVATLISSIQGQVERQNVPAEAEEKADGE